MRNLTPLGGDIGLAAIHGHATLIKLLAITQDILTYLTEIKIQITAIITGSTILTGIDERIEQPEFDILDIGLFKVVSINLSHHSTPLGLGLTKRTIGIQVACQIIRATFLRIIGQIKHVKG